MNIPLLESAISRNGDSRESLAKALCISQSRLDAKIRGVEEEFRQNEIVFIRNRYHLSLEEVGKIFFES